MILKSIIIALICCHKNHNLSIFIIMAEQIVQTEKLTPEEEKQLFGWGEDIFGVPVGSVGQEALTVQ